MTEICKSPEWIYAPNALKQRWEFSKQTSFRASYGGKVCGVTATKSNEQDEASILQRTTVRNTAEHVEFWSRNLHPQSHHRTYSVMAHDFQGDPLHALL